MKKAAGLTVLIAAAFLISFAVKKLKTDREFQITEEKILDLHRKRPLLLQGSFKAADET